MTAKKTTKATSTKAAKKAPPKMRLAPEIIDAGGGILVEIAPPPAEATKTSGKAKPAKNAKAEAEAEAKPKKMSALDAAAKVLAKGEPMNTKQLIEAMSEQGLWTSPGGATPWATLYAAITREIKTKGLTDCRFKKMDKGLFGFNFEKYGK